MNQVFPLLTGYLGWPEPPSLDPVMHPVYAYLIVTPDGKPILVDTGNPRTLVGQARALPWFDASLAMSPADSLVARLAGTGHAISDIDLVIATHFDFDHCGNTDLFDNLGIECVVQSAQLDDALTGDHNDRQLWDRPGLRYRRVSGDTTIEPGITLLETSGHAVGHQSLLVEIDGGPILLTIDAIAEPSAMADRPLPSFYVEDEQTWRRSREKLIGLAESTDAVLIFGHDAGQVELLIGSPGPIVLTDALRQSGSPVRKAR